MILRCVFSLVGLSGSRTSVSWSSWSIVSQNLWYLHNSCPNWMTKSCREAWNGR